MSTGILSFGNSSPSPSAIFTYSRRADGLAGLWILLTIYFDILKSTASEDVKDSALHYLFDYADTVILHSEEFRRGIHRCFPG